MNYYNVLREDANKSIIVIEHREVYRFVTCCSKYSDCVTITQDDNEDYISVYDIIFHKIIEIPLIEISRHYHYDIDDAEKNSTAALEAIEKICNIIKKYKDENKELPDEDIYNLSIKPGLVDIFNLDNENYILDFLSYTNFTLTLDDIKADVVLDSKKEYIKKCCHILIYKKVDEITAELNELKQQSTDPEDHSDIDTIIQMYHDCATNEVDYTNCEKLIDYLRVWPALLLPIPEKIEKFVYKISKINKQPVDSSINDFMSIVDSSLTHTEISELLTELETLQSEFNHETDEINLTPFKEYLKYKLNNEYKQS